MQQIQTENNIVGACWKTVRKDLKKIVESKGGELKTCGIRFWDRPVPLDNSSGQWAERSMQSKPSRWLFTYKGQGYPLDLADKMAYFSLRNEALAFAVRAVPVLCDDEQQVFSFVESSEWIIIFIAKSLTPRGSSSATAHSNRLEEGIFTITTDDREFEVPLECIGLIKPEDKLHSRTIRDIDEKLQQVLSESVDCYILNEQTARESFLQRVDKLTVGNNVEPHSQNKSWITDQDFKNIEILFNGEQPNLMLWGDDYSSILTMINHLEQQSTFDFVHYEALPTWTELSLARLIDDENLENKVVCLHGAERLKPELVLPAILPRLNHISLATSDGQNIAKLTQTPRALVFTGHHLEPSQISQWYRVAHSHLKWFRCEATVSATDAVQQIYQEEGIKTSTNNWFDNLFVIMWEELKAYLPVSPETLAKITRNSLRRDASGTWDLDATPIQKGILVQEIESRLSPMIASLSVELRKQCVNSLLSTLEISQTQGQRLLFLTRML